MELRTLTRKEKITAYSAWGAVCLFWGTTYLAIRIGVRTIPPGLFGGLRFLTAGLIFLVYLKWRGHALPQRRELLDVAVVGIALLAISNGLVIWAEQWVPSGVTALLIATLPFWMAGFEAVLPAGERLRVRKVIGIVIGFSGLVILFTPEIETALDMAYLRGILALLFAPLCWAAGSVYSKSRPAKSHPLMAASIEMIVAGIVLLLVGGMFGEWKRFSLDAEGLAATAYLIIFGSIVGYGSFVYALAKLPATKVSMYAYVNPVIAVLLGWLILDERMDWSVMLATAVVLLGVVLVKSSKS
jgi:drug/metabolite transporter (DMT)-like permease